MRSLRTLCAIIPSLVFCTLGSTQPNPFGCHFFRDAPSIGSLTAQERSDIEETIARSDTFDIIHYDIHLDVSNYNSQSLKAATTITYRTLMEGQTLIRFDLFQLVVDSVVGQDGQFSFTQDEEFLTVQLPDPPIIGEDNYLTVYYGGSPYRDPNWGGFYFQSNYIFNLGIGISTIPPNFGKVWYPCFDSFVERATYSYHVKSSGTYRFHGQGNFLGETIVAGDTVIRSYALDQPIPTHLSAVAVADYAEHAYQHAGAYGEIPVTLRAKPNLLDTMIAKFEHLGAAIDACEHWFGPYPFERVGYVHTVDGALEIPTNVAYPAFMNSQDLLLNRALFTHELGHHWWGDIVTPHIHNEMWLKEGPAEYSGHLIEEWLGGQVGFEKALKDNLRYVLRYAHINDEGFHSLSPMPDEHIYGSHTYYKGALVLHNLRGYVGDSLFRHAMHSIQTDMAYSTITGLEFKDALEEHTQIDLDPFFDAWVFGPSYSVFEIRSANAEPAGNEWNVQLQIGQKLRGGSNLHGMVPVDLTMISATGEVHDQQIMLNGELIDLMVTSPFEPERIILNRYARLNQARLDHELTIPAGETVNSHLPYVDLQLISGGSPEDVELRVEHLWVSPDQSPLTEDVVNISNSHYWNIDGRWPEEADLQARLTYAGLGVNQLDHDLVDGNEYGMAILYRAHPLEPWAVYPDQIVNAGSLLNGQGSILVTKLRRGQYSFGKTTGFVGLGAFEEVEVMSMSAHPVPANDKLIIEGSLPANGTLIMDVLTMDGRIALRTTMPAEGPFRKELDLSRLQVGAYLVHVMTTDGTIVGTQRFEVAR